MPYIKVNQAAMQVVSVTSISISVPFCVCVFCEKKELTNLVCDFKSSWVIGGDSMCPNRKYSFVSEDEKRSATFNVSPVKNVD